MDQSKQNEGMSEKKRVKVVAALFSRIVKSAQALSNQSSHLEVLIFQRAQHVSGAGFWEFPGGKIEAGESPEQALIREIREELNIQIKVGDLVSTHQHDYPEKQIELSLYLAQASSALHFDLVDHQDYAWVKLTDFAHYRLAAADLPFLPLLEKKLIQK